MQIYQLTNLAYLAARKSFHEAALDYAAGKAVDPEILSILLDDMKDKHHAYAEAALALTIATP